MDKPRAETHNQTEPDEAPHYTGHRSRLRARLLSAGPDALEDYELVEALLYAAIPRRDVKPLAKELLKEFGGLWGLVNAAPSRLLAFGLSEGTVATLCTVAAIALRAHKATIVGKPLLSNWQRIVDYCRMAMIHEPVEQFRLLFFDRKNHLIGEEVHQTGTLDHTPVYPREVVKRALELGAGALVLAHNHPSGDPTPSKDDIVMTRALIEACRPLDILIHDHLIVGHGETTSFKSLGLL